MTEHERETSPTEPPEEHSAPPPPVGHRAKTPAPGGRVSSYGEYDYRPRGTHMSEGARTTPENVQPSGTKVSPSDVKSVAGDLASGKSVNDVAHEAGGQAVKSSLSAATGGVSDIAADTSELVKGVESDGSLVGDTAAVAKAATTGAKLGSFVPVVGNATGAVIGGALQAVRTKRFRHLLIAATLALPVLIAASFTMLIMAITSPDTDESIARVASNAAVSDGLDTETQLAIYESGRHGGSWELMSAIAYENSNGNVEFAGSDTSAESKAPEPDKPFGTFGIVIEKANPMAIKYGIEPLPTGEPIDSDAEIEFATELVTASLLASVEDKNAEYKELGLPRGEVPQIDTGVDTTPNSAATDDTAPDATRQVGEDTTKIKLHEATKSIYVDGLKNLDGALDGIDVRAEPIFDLAFTWRLGVPRCGSGAGSFGVLGAWTHPLPDVVRLSSPFGMRKHPIFGTMKLHSGTDLAGPSGAKVLAAAAGRITFAGWQNGFGNTIQIDHGGGIGTLYAHMRDTPALSVGDTVVTGQVVGTQGSTGDSTGDHLHFNVYISGKVTDPEPFMAERGVILGKKPVSNVATTTTTPTTTNTGSYTGPKSLSSTKTGGAKILLDEEQLQNAHKIISIVNQSGEGQNVAEIALITALQESSLRNLEGGDRDSLGLFQQRPSSGWGTKAEITDPEYSTKAFLGGAKGPNNGSPPGLLDVKNWASKTPNDAAQAVQRSGYPNAYGPWLPVAKDIILAVGGLTGVGAGEDGCATVGSAPGTLKVVTYNLCVAHCDGLLKRSWKDRIPGAVAQISATTPDLVAVQEAGFGKPRRSEFDRQIQTRGLKAGASYSTRAIFYNPATVSPLDANGKSLGESGFLLGHRPPGEKKTSGVAQVFRDLRTGEKFIFTSLHPSPNEVNESYRLSQFKVAEARIDALRRKHPGSTTVYAGDLNSHFPASKNRTKVAPFFESLGYVSSETMTPNLKNAKFDSNNFRGQNPKRGIRIDHILVEKARATVFAWGLEHSADMKNPDSDHNLVWAHIALK